MGLWQLYKYNDLKKTDLLKDGDIIFLQPKGRNLKNAESETGIRCKISQEYGVKLKSLCKKNNLDHDSDLKVGTFLSLK